MASHMKKLFHRRKDSDPERPPQHMRAPLSNRSDPALRSSRYESTEPGDLPQTGDYPVKGNDSSVILQQGRKPSISRSRRNSGTSHNLPYRSTNPNQHEIAKHAPNIIPTVAGSMDAYQQSRANQEGRGSNISRDPSGNVESPTTVTQTVTTTRTRVPHQEYPANRGTSQNEGYVLRSAPHEQSYSSTMNADPQHQDQYMRSNTASESAPGSASWGHTIFQDQGYVSGINTTPQLQESAPRNSTGSQLREYPPQKNASIRPVDKGASQIASMSQPSRGDLTPQSNLGSKAYDSVNPQDEYDAGLARHRSIPRKQISTSAGTQNSSIPASSPPRGQISQSRHQSVLKPLPYTPAAVRHEYTDRQVDSTSQPSSILNKSRPVPTNGPGLRDAQDVVARAKTDTYDTNVVETVAPAVVHENVHRAVHHIREEVITRETHTHDVFHRIQPIVDVEVLPPRHFLPVEGGGLVEISAQEVPGRGSNWVIAETASKIPSDQAAPPGTTQFTARSFPGREGDAVKYIGSEGYEKTEQTWVHHPELEEGARLTGQSWPMILGSEPPSNGEFEFSGAHESSTPKTTKGRSSGNKPAIQASSAQRAGATSGRI